MELGLKSFIKSTFPYLYKTLSIASTILQPLILLGDIGSDWYYIFTSEFSSPYIFYLNLLFLLILPVLVYGTIIVFLVKCIISKPEKRKKKIRLLAFWIIFGLPLSNFYPLVGFVFGLFETKIYAPQDLVKIQALIQSFPQLILQASNNTYLNKWTQIAYISFSFSLISVIRGLYLFSYATHKLSEGLLKRDFVDATVKKTEEILKEKDLIFDKKKIEKVINYELFKALDDLPLIYEQDEYALEEYEEETRDSIMGIIKDEVYKFYQEHVKLSFSFKGCLHRSSKANSLLLFCEMFLNLITITLSALYVGYADFSIKILRFVYLGFIISILFSALKAQRLNRTLDFSHKYRDFIIARIVLMSHYNYFLKIIFNADLKLFMSHELQNEIKVLISTTGGAFSVLVINNYQTGTWDGLNFFCTFFGAVSIALTFLRVYQLLMKIKHSSKVSAETI